MNHHLTPLEIGTLIAVATFVWWVFLTFQSKSESQKQDQEFRQRINKLENRMDRFESSLCQVARDTSYIRGKLEQDGLR